MTGQRPLRKQRCRGKSADSERQSTSQQSADILSLGLDPVIKLSRRPGYGQAERRKLGPAQYAVILVDTGGSPP